MKRSPHENQFSRSKDKYNILFVTWGFVGFHWAASVYGHIQFFRRVDIFDDCDMVSMVTFLFNLTNQELIDRPQHLPGFFLF